MHSADGAGNLVDMQENAEEVLETLRLKPDSPAKR